MNSAQFCATKEWKVFKDRKWSELYTMEDFYNRLPKEEWIEAGCPDWPHPKETGNVIRCAYCGWYGLPTKERYLVFEHVLPIWFYPDLRLDERNIQLACNLCNKEKGAKVLHHSLSAIIKQYQRDVLEGQDR